MRFPGILYLFFLTVFVPFLPTLAHADFQDGMKAYNVADEETALKEWLPLAEQGDAEAQFVVGALYNYGYGVPRDYTQAADWYRRAAEQGIGAAQWGLGELYENGQGVPQDYTEAVKWYRLAAEQDVVGAQFDLGKLYNVGQGVPQDYAQAREWWLKAAEQGDARALKDLGQLYEQAQDYVQAHMWFNLAISYGHRFTNDKLIVIAEKKRRQIAKKMTPKQLAEAQRLAREWEAQHLKKLEG